MNTVFKPDTTDYFKIGAVFIKEALHKAKITVDEGGTTAAAATLIQGGATAALPAEDIFVANSPFIFVIRDTETDAILFMGEINQLSEKESAASEMKVLDEAKAEVISEPENIREEDDAQIIRTYEELQKLLQTIEETDPNKKNTVAKLRSYTEEYFNDHILLFGGRKNERVF